jgi:flagellar biosynthesis protein FliQ
VVSPELVMDIMQEGLKTALCLSLPPLGLALIVGLCVSMFQAVTSIQEQTMVFIPKILAAGIALLIFMPWMIAMISDYTTRMFVRIPDFIR